MEQIEQVGRIGFTLFFFLLNIFEGFKIDTSYPHKLVVLYVYPLWRLLLLITLVVGGLWCRALSITLAFSIIFYFMDLQLLLYKEV
jgi:hypothetical protein